MTDIFLDRGDSQDTILLDCHRVIITGTSVEVRNQANLSQPTPHRRALTHNDHDGLTINTGDDYPGGVHLFGVDRIEGKAVAHHSVPTAVVGVALASWDRSVTIVGEIKFQKQIPGSAFVAGAASEVSLQDTIGQLEARIAALEQKLR